MPRPARVTKAPAKALAKLATKSPAKSPAPEAAADDVHLNPNDSVGALVRVTYLTIRQAFHDELRTHNVTSAQWVFLRVLWEHEGINQKELSRLVNTHPTTAVSALAVLERNGYIRRERSSADRREVHVYLTEAGRMLERVLIPHARAINANLLKGFTPEERETLKSLLQRLISNLRN